MGLCPQTLPKRQQLIMDLGKLLVICGPTATGKTGLAFAVVDFLPGEIISADSRQVYLGMDVITGKDIPAGFVSSTSDVWWRDRYLPYYVKDEVRIWLVDLVRPDEQFSAALWRECTRLVITDIHRRGKLPIVVGDAGLYIKSLFFPLEDMDVSPLPQLRQKLAPRPASWLFNYLNKLDPLRAAAMNISDRYNPRRLVRAIEICQTAKMRLPPSPPSVYKNCLLIGLTAPREVAYQRINHRVDRRLQQGARQEVETLIELGYDWNLPSLHTSGYRIWKDFFLGHYGLEEVVKLWKYAEHRDFRRQQTWFKAQPGITWFDVTQPRWQDRVKSEIRRWYNQENAPQD